MSEITEFTIEELREHAPTLIIPAHWQRWIWIADLHGGSPVGLTPYPTNEFQQALLKRYDDSIAWYYANYGQPHVCVVVGDPTEGVDQKLDIQDHSIISQYQNAAEAICLWNASEEYIIITGTKVHTHLQHQQLEEILADKIKLVSQDWYGTTPIVSVRRKLKTRVNSWFEVQARHFISRSVIPHGRFTAPARSQMWEIMNSALRSFNKKEPAKWADLLMFGHAHYYTRTDNGYGETVILPSWKAIGDKFGDEICDGHIDIGCVGTFISDEDEKQWILRKRLYEASVISRTENR